MLAVFLATVLSIDHLKVNTVTTTIIRKKLPNHGKRAFYQPSINRWYQRIIGSIVWANEKPGYACAVAEELVSRHQQPRYHVLALVEAMDHAKMLEKCLEMKGDIKIDEFYAPPDPEAIHFLRYWNNQQQEKLLPEIHTTTPRYYNDGKIVYHLNLLKGTMQPESKKLYTHGDIDLASELNSVPNPIGDAHYLDYPAAAALGYCITVLLTQPYKSESETVYFARRDYKHHISYRKRRKN